MSTLLSVPPNDTRQDPATTSYRFRCIVYQEKTTGLYVAECIDLNIMVKAKKQNKATRELVAAMTGHIKVALEVGEESLLSRPSPLARRLHYHWIRALAGLFKMVSRNAKLFEYDSNEQTCPC